MLVTGTLVSTHVQLNLLFTEVQWTTSDLVLHSTHTDRLSFVSQGAEYPFHFGESALRIFFPFISNCQIALSPCRSASPCLKDNNISVYWFHNNSATLQNMT